jgi:mxaA protein
VIAAMLTLVLAASAPAQVSAVVEQPRQTGYFVGDLLTQRVLLDSAGSGRSPTTLPTPGRVSAWFERRRITLETDSSSRHWLTVQYQILNAPQKLAVVNLPAWTLPLKAAAGSASVVLKIPSRRINVAPLSPPGSPTQVGVADLHPDRLAPLVALAPLRRAVALSVGALVLTLAAWLGWLLWRNRRAAAEQPFARALRELRALDDREPRAWQTLHRAFDRTAGRVIQNATLPELFERAPQLIPAREQIEQFFAQSRELFFGAPALAQEGPSDTPAIVPRALCADLRRIERQYER